MKKSIVVLSLLAFGITAAIAANRAPVKQPSAAYKKLQLAIKQETRNYLRGDGLIEKASPVKPSANTKVKSSRLKGGKTPSGISKL